MNSSPQHLLCFPSQKQNQNILSFISHDKLYTPKPIKMKIPALLNMMESEYADLDKNFKQNGKEEEMSFNSLSKKMCLSFVGNLKESDFDSSYPNSETTSPNKTPSADDIDESMSDIFYDRVPSRASNPHVFDDYFERRNITFDEDEDGDEGLLNFLAK